MLVARRSVELAGEVGQVVGEDARPDHVDLEHVDVVGACGEELLVVIQRSVLL
jgi:hypothetical protein